MARYRVEKAEPDTWGIQVNRGKWVWCISGGSYIKFSSYEDAAAKIDQWKAKEATANKKGED